MALLPLSLLAANPFTDLVPGSVHNGNIDAIYNAGITTGCVPNAEYCPTDFVTRQEMASFLARTAGLGGNPPVANAKTAQTATNAEQLNGKAANAIVRSASAGTETAAPLTSADLTIIPVNITAPTAGFLLINFSGTFNVTGATPVIHYGVDVDIPAGNGWTTSFATSAAITAPANGFQAGGLDYRVAVPAGAHTVRIKAHNDGTGTVAFSGGHLTVVFMPFDGAGAGSLEAPASEPQGGADVARP